MEKKNSVEINELPIESFEEHYTLSDFEMQYISKMHTYEEDFLSSFNRAHFTAEFVVKIAYHSPDFVKKCEHEEYEGFWADFLQIYGGSVVKQIN